MDYSVAKPLEVLCDFAKDRCRLFAGLMSLKAGDQVSHLFCVTLREACPQEEMHCVVDVVQVG